MSTLLPPLESISPDNHGAAVVATGYVLIVTTILFVVVRIATTFSLKRGAGLDDAFLFLATVGCCPTFSDPARSPSKKQLRC